MGQVDLQRSFGTEDYQAIWSQLNNYLDVYAIRTSTHSSEYQYRWDDSDFVKRQVEIISKGYKQ